MFRRVLFFLLLLTALPSLAQNKGDVKPLIQTKWSQEAPFNLFFPKLKQNGKTTKALTGCAPLQMAQILNYYKYPKKAADGKPLLWENSFNVYSKSVPEKKVRFVANLIKNCAKIVPIHYEMDQTEVALWSLVRGMIMGAKFSPYLALYSRKSFAGASGKVEWENLIRTEIRGGRPVLMIGSDKSRKYSHIFLVDGIQGAKFHVNFGWGGVKDGYYELDKVYTFSRDQLILVNIGRQDFKPRETVIQLTKAGTLQQKLKGFRAGSVHYLKVVGPMNASDFAALRALAHYERGKTESSGLRTLDLSKAVIGELPDRALESTYLQYVVLPKSIQIAKNALKIKNLLVGSAGIYCRRVFF